MAEVWPFIPLVGIEESLSWLSDVIPSAETEDIFVLRTGRQSFKFRFGLSDQDFAKAEGLIRANPTGDWRVPVWPERSFLTGPVLSADTQITADTNADYRAGGDTVVFGDGAEPLVLPIASVGTGSITLEGAVGQDIDAGVSVPLRTGFAPEGLIVERVFAGHTIASLGFQIRDNIELPESPFVQYLGYDVLTDPSVSVQPLSGVLMKATVLVDNGFGPVVVEDARDFLTGRHSATFIDETSAKRWSRRKWFHSLSGRSGRFWLPTWARDLELTAPVSAASNSISVSPVLPNLADYVGRQIIMDDGAHIYREITAAIQSGSNHRLYLTPLGRDVDQAQIGFLNLVRLDTDTINITHQDGMRQFVNLPMIEVPA